VACKKYLAEIALAWMISNIVPAAASQNMPGTGVDTLHITADITPDFTAKTISIRETIRFRSTQDGLREISFSPNDLTVDDATINGKESPVRIENAALIFTLPSPLRKGAVATLSLTFHGAPRKGLVWDATGQSVYSDYFACSWLICNQDTPGDKMTSEISLELPRGMLSTSVGDQKPVRTLSNTAERHVWQSKRGYSAYLMGFAAGRFQENHDGKKLRFLSHVADPQVFKGLFGTSKEMLAYYERKAGVPLPSQYYTQVLIDGSEAQEAATYATIGRKELDPILENPQEDWVIAHEMAHQWWGNLVTCTGWQDFWLNEGITTFMTAAWKEHKHGRAAYIAEMDKARARLARAARLGFDKPLTFAGDYPTLGTRRAIQYGKGALFMDHLRKLLGEKLFWAGLKRFTRQHAGGAVNSQDLQRAFEDVNKQDLSGPFKEWVYG
jgi:aminopeptidase N